MISPFDYKISGISCFAREFFHKTKTFSYVSVTGLGNRNNYDTDNDGNENFHKQELKLN